MPDGVVARRVAGVSVAGTPEENHAATRSARARLVALAVGLVVMALSPLGAQPAGAQTTPGPCPVDPSHIGFAIGRPRSVAHGFRSR